MDRERILSEFIAQHGSHYTILEPLGAGGYGFTYHARDERRDVDVCVKLFMDRVAPAGAQRDWRITSSVKHPLIVDTFTVEHFGSDASGQPGVAVVTRFIPGRDLDKVVDRFRALKQGHQAELRDAYVREISEDICSAIKACHDAGHGHGDLSERNVMVVQASPPHDHRRRFSAIVIDFDNASYKPELRDLEESKLIEKDVRSLIRLVGILTFESLFHDDIQQVLKECTTAQQVQQTLAFMLKTIRRVDGDSFDAYDEDHWNLVLRSYAAGSMVGILPHAIYAFMLNVVKEMKRTGAFESARAALQHRILTDPAYPAIKGSMEIRHVDVEAAARSLVE